MATSSPETRASLILRLRDRDDVAAWDEFVGLYGPVVYRVARGRGFQPADADNLVQEVMFAVSRSISQWLARADRGSFRAWLRKIARNEAADTISRRATRSLGRDGDAAARVLNELPARDAVTTHLDLEYERTVFQWAAERVRASVAPHTWQAFWLTHVDGLTIEKAAKQLQARPGNVYFGRSRVMARIKKLVQEYEEHS